MKRIFHGRENDDHLDFILSSLLEFRLKIQNLELPRRKDQFSLDKSVHCSVLENRNLNKSQFDVLGISIDSSKIGGGKWVTHFAPIFSNNVDSWDVLFGNIYDVKKFVFIISISQSSKNGRHLLRVV